MGVRGPKSGSALALSVIGPGGIEAVRRPEPPAELNDEMAAEWRAIVNSLPADWFPRYSHCNLVNLCQAIVYDRRIAEQIEHLWEAEVFDEQAYNRLLKMKEREVRNIASLSGKCRVSQSSNYDRKKLRDKPETRNWAPRHARLESNPVDREELLHPRGKGHRKTG